MDEANKKFTLGGKEFHEGDFISIDGSTGNIYDGIIPTVDATIAGEFGRIMAVGLALAAGLSARRFQRVSLPVLLTVVMDYQIVGTLGGEIREKQGKRSHDKKRDSQGQPTPDRLGGN